MIARRWSSNHPTCMYLLVGWYRCSTRTARVWVSWTLHSSAKQQGPVGILQLQFPRAESTIQSRVEIEYLQQLYDGNTVKVYPIGAVSQDLGAKIWQRWSNMICRSVSLVMDVSIRSNRGCSQERWSIVTLTIRHHRFSIDRSLTTRGKCMKVKKYLHGIDGHTCCREENNRTKIYTVVAYTRSKLISRHFICIFHFTLQKAELINSPSPVTYCHASAAGR